jgi:membrane-associated phospholipid phosphatase
MRVKFLSSAALALALCAVSPAHADDHDWKVASDVGVAGLVSLALGKTALEQDWKGGEELALSLGATGMATYGLKQTVHETRPNGRDDHSFPSGHTSISFASAGYLQQRYGWKVGGPATLVAGLVGLARVEAHEHHWYDAVAGAAIGEGAAILITHRWDERVAILPWGDTRGGGVALLARF